MWLKSAKLNGSILPSKPDIEKLTARFGEHDGVFFYCTDVFHFKKPTFLSMEHLVSPEKTHFIKSLTKADPWELSPFSTVDIQTPEWNG